MRRLVGRIALSCASTLRKKPDRTTPNQRSDGGIRSSPRFHSGCEGRVRLEREFGLQGQGIPTKTGLESRVLCEDTKARPARPLDEAVGCRRVPAVADSVTRPEAQAYATRATARAPSALIHVLRRSASTRVDPDGIAYVGPGWGLLRRAAEGSGVRDEGHREVPLMILACGDSRRSFESDQLSCPTSAINVARKRVGWMAWLDFLIRTSCTTSGAESRNAAGRASPSQGNISNVSSSFSRKATNRHCVDRNAR